MKLLSNIPLFPVSASSFSDDVDTLFIVELLLSLVATVVIGGVTIFLAAYYRRKKPGDVGELLTFNTTALEIGWSVIPGIIFLGFFVWGAKVWFHQQRAPANATVYYVTGKQWMWKVQHPEGRREINELHLPLGQPAKMVMTSEDVIHSFYVPAFRTKADVIPGRYTTVWFEPTKVGEFHLFCAEYCGAEHSRMIGHVVVMEPADYARWLQEVPGDQVAASVTTPDQVFANRGCPTCHRTDTAIRAPKLEGLLGSSVKLANGETVVADENYIRESILVPTAKVVAGYQPIMPTFKGQLSEDELLLLVQYVSAMSPKGTAGAAAPVAPIGSAAPTSQALEVSHSKGEAR